MRKLTRTLHGETAHPPPVWLMRQAGRYLPEYMRVRAQAGSFLDLCYNPDLACEVTLQPIRRFAFDAAILFSDILVVPHALGRDLRFEEGHGPRMTPMRAGDVAKLKSERFHRHLEPVYETVRRIRGKLPEQTALIGFCGAPWTVATYMIAGEGTPDQAPARMFAYRYPEAFGALIDLLVEVSAEYLVRQIESGADVVQIFDSWSGVLDDACFEAFCATPVQRMVGRIRERYPDIPVIAFPKGAGHRIERYREATRVTAIGLDWTVPLDVARKLQMKGAIQGNLDPLRLAAGGKALEEGVLAILEALGKGPLIFNLGHGIVPQTPIGNVERMLEILRKGA